MNKEVSLILSSSILFSITNILFLYTNLVNGKEAIRFMMYEEMRIYRPSIPDFPAPWMKNYRDIIHPISFENKAMDVDDALYNQGSTPICGSGSAAFFGGLEHNFDSKQESESDDKFYDAQAFVSSKDSK